MFANWMRFWLPVQPHHTLCLANEFLDSCNKGIMIHFKEHRLAPSGYVIQSSKSAGGFLTPWVIEASNDGVNWRELDQCENYETLSED